jgi:pimeloyl-ACP methyl ester carboxylesterase
MWKWTKRIIVAFLFVLLVTGIVLHTPDIKQSELEDTYFLENSAYANLTVSTLDNEDMDLRMHYQDINPLGTETIVLVHGAFSSSHTFLDWANILAQEGYRVILPDLPYFGLTGGFEDEITSYRRSAEAIEQLLTFLEIEGVHIAGNSLGGGVSWFFASEYPNRIQSVTLIDAVYPYQPDGPRELVATLFSADWFASLVGSMTPRYILKNMLSSAYGDPERLNDDVLDRYFDLIRRENTRRWILQVEQEMEPEFKYDDRIASIDPEKLFIMWGEKDTWIEPSVIDLFLDTNPIDSSHVIIFEDLGHVPMEENPSTVFDYISLLNSLNNDIS